MEKGLENYIKTIKKFAVRVFERAIKISLCLRQVYPCLPLNNEVPVREGELGLMTAQLCLTIC